MTSTIPLLVIGSIGGFYGAVEMLIAMRYIDKGVRSIPERVYGRIANHDPVPISLSSQLIIAHFGIGITLGVAFPWFITSLIGLPMAYATALPHALVAGALYGVLLFYMFIMLGVADVFTVHFSRREIAIYAGGFILYGLVIGVFFGLSDSLWFPILDSLGLA